MYHNIPLRKDHPQQQPLEKAIEKLLLFTAFLQFSLSIFALDGEGSGFGEFLPNQYQNPSI